MKGSLLRIAAWVFSPLLLMILLFAPELLAMPLILLIGWLPSAARLLGAWHPDTKGVLLFSFSVLLLLAGSHTFLNWLFVRWRSQDACAGESKLPWKWTLCGFGILFCTLVAIGSLILTTHQLYWTAKSPDPLLADPFRERFRVLAAAMNLRKAAEEADWDTLKTREAFWQGKSHANLYASESIQAVWVEQDHQRLRAVVLIPRRPQHRSTARFSVIQPETNIVNHKLEEFPQVLASFGIRQAEPPVRTQSTLLP